MTGIEYLRSLHEVCRFASVEPDRMPGPASGKELKRWLDSRSLHINGAPISATQKIAFPIKSVVLFPSSRKRRCTLL